MENWANNANKIGRRMNECEEDWRENLLPADDDNGAIAKEQWKEGGRAEGRSRRPAPQIIHPIGCVPTGP